MALMSAAHYQGVYSREVHNMDLTLLVFHNYMASQYHVTQIIDLVRSSIAPIEYVSLKVTL